MLQRMIPRVVFPSLTRVGAALLAGFALSGLPAVDAASLPMATPLLSASLGAQEVGGSGAGAAPAILPLEAGDGDPILPGDARAVALADLAALEACAAGPESHLATLQRLRTLHLLAVDDEDRMVDAWETHRALAGSPWGRTPDGRALTEAYRGALQALEGRHGFWPHRRVRDLRQGLAYLDAQVEAHPAQVELRYLRLVSTAFLPSLLGRGDGVRTDLEVLARLLPSSAHAYPLRTWTAMADAVEALLVQRTPEVAREAAPRFREARARARAADLPLAPGCRVG